MTSWLRPCIWQSLVCLSCPWFAWLDFGNILRQFTGKCLVFSALLGSTLDTIFASVHEAFWEMTSWKCSYSALAARVGTCSHVCCGALGIHHFQREGGHSSRCSHLVCGHYLSDPYPAVTCSVPAAPEVRVLRSHLARGHNFYRPLLARQWIHVCVSLRRLLEYLTCRARRRHLQWYLLAGFAGDDTPRAVFFDVDARGDSTGAVLGQGIALAVEAHGDSTGAVLGQGDMLVWSFWSARPGRVPAGCRVRQMTMVLTLRIPLRCRRCSSCAVVDVAVLMQRCDPVVGPDS